jgi:hypothetical protein
MMDHSERAKVINRSNFWGTMIGLTKLLCSISKWNNVPNTGWFLWETRTSSGHYALALTQLYSVYEDNRYIKKITYYNNGCRGFTFRSRFSTFPDAFTTSLDSFTTYILKSTIDGRYYELPSYIDMYNHIIPDSEHYRLIFSSSTLDEAIERARTRYQDIAHRSYFSSPSTCCPPISRFISFNASKNSCVNRVWSLRDMCLFYVQNYFEIKFHDKRCKSVNLHRVPKKIQNILINEFRAKRCNTLPVHICNEKVRKQREREKLKKERRTHAVMSMMTRSRSRAINVHSVIMTRSKSKNY